MNKLEAYNEILVLFSAYYLIVFSDAIILMPNSNYPKPYNSLVKWDEQCRQAYDVDIDFGSF